MHRTASQTVGNSLSTAVLEKLHVATYLEYMSRFSVVGLVNGYILREVAIGTVSRVFSLNYLFDPNHISRPHLAQVLFIPCLIAAAKGFYADRLG